MEDGERLGMVDGERLGNDVGNVDGGDDGILEGVRLGDALGFAVGDTVGVQWVRPTPGSTIHPKLTASQMDHTAQFSMSMSPVNGKNCTQYAYIEISPLLFPMFH